MKGAQAPWGVVFVSAIATAIENRLFSQPSG
jgi:hypothetical protein